MESWIILELAIPEGPITANNSPGFTTPETSRRRVRFSLNTCNPRKTSCTGRESSGQTNCRAVLSTLNFKRTKKNSTKMRICLVKKAHYDFNLRWRLIYIFFRMRLRSRNSLWNRISYIRPGSFKLRDATFQIFEWKLLRKLKKKKHSLLRRNFSYYWNFCS